jgi:uncharacterized protein YndB with AHSA1/START domain
MISGPRATTHFVPPSARDAMLNQPEPACLVIADITGYTSYLAGVELDHAQDILADLTDTVVGALRPTFRLAKLEGDAAFVYRLTSTIDPSLLMDTIERTYFAFRRRLRDIAQATTCDCNACTRMPALDLKVVAHHGAVLRQRVAGRDELVGSPVIVAHRLLKNSITERTGIRAYALYTEDCLRAAGTEPGALDLIEHRETFEHVGEVVAWVADLGAAWSAEQVRTRIVVESETAMATFEFDLPAPPAIAWEYLTSPVLRPRWQADVQEVIQASPGGRRGVGTTNHCVHSKDAVVEEILDWRPPQYFTVSSLLPVPNVPKVRSTDTLVETPTGTHLTMSFERPRSAKDRAIVEAVLPHFEPGIRTGVDALRSLLVEEVARRAAEVAIPEPALPASEGRFLRQPVDSEPIRSS